MLSCTKLDEVLVDYKWFHSSMIHSGHIYVLRSFCRKKIVNSIIKNIYFSDHEIRLYPRYKIILN